MVKYPTHGEEGHFCTLSYLKFPSISHSEALAIMSS